MRCIIYATCLLTRHNKPSTHVSLTLASTKIGTLKVLSRFSSESWRQSVSKITTRWQVSLTSKLKLRIFRVALASKLSVLSSATLRKKSSRMILQIQSLPTKQTLNSWKTILRSSASSASSMSASLCSIHGPTISIKLTSSTSWTMILLLKSVTTSEPKTLKSSGYRSSRVRLLYQLMTSSVPSEN